MKRIFICSTPYQLIVATLLATQLNEERKNVQNDLILTDNFVNYANIKKNVEKTNFFKNVYNAKINDYIYSKKFFKKMKKAMTYIFPKYYIKKSIDDIKSFDYEEIYYNNDDLFLYNFVFLCKNNNLRVYRFEEGYSSYINDFCSKRGQLLCEIRNRILFKKSFKNLFKGFYLYNPELVLYNSNYPKYTIKKNNDKYFKSLIENFFDLKNKKYDFKQKWIIFEESFYQNSNFNEDYLLYEEIINYLGKNNVIIKLHPRSKINRFEKIGIEVMENDGTPWEAILMTGKIKNKNFISLISGSVINSRLLLSDDTNSWLLYKCIDNFIPLSNKDLTLFIDNLKEKKLLNNIIIPYNYSEFKKEFYK